MARLTNEDKEWVCYALRIGEDNMEGEWFEQISGCDLLVKLRVEIENAFIIVHGRFKVNHDDMQEKIDDKWYDVAGSKMSEAFSRIYDRLKLGV